MAAGFSRRVGFQVVADAAALVPARIGGLDVLALLDTGAAVTVVSRAFARRSGLPLVGQGTVQGLAASTAVDRVAGLDVSIGDFAGHASQAVAADLGAASLALGHQIDVVLGHDAFKQAALDIDFDRREVLLAPTGTIQPPPGSRELELSFGANGEPIVMASVEGGSAVPAILDLGCSSPLHLARDGSDAQRRLDGRRTSTAAIAGVDGINISTSLVVRGLALQDVIINDVPAEVINHWRSASATARIGFPVLARFRVVVDFPQRRVWLRPNAQATIAPFRKDRSGLGVAYQGNRLVVVHVALASPAERAGWRRGDAITAIDGHPVSAAYYASELWHWRYAPSGQVVRLTVNSGDVRKLVLADYY